MSVNKHACLRSRVNVCWKRTNICLCMILYIPQKNVFFNRINHRHHAVKIAHTHAHTHTHTHTHTHARYAVHGTCIFGIAPSYQSWMYLKHNKTPTSGCIFHWTRSRTIANNHDCVYDYASRTVTVSSFKVIFLFCDLDQSLSEWPFRSLIWSSAASQ